MGGIKIPKKSVHPRKTYILNLDGMRADYFMTQGHQGCLTTTLKYLAEHGVRFSKCKDILPAVTATNHTSILTSTHLETHGIYGMGAHFQDLDFDHYRISSKHGIATVDKYHHKHLECLPTFFNVVKQNNPDSKTAFIIGKYWVNFLADESCDILIYAGNQSNPDYVTDSPSYILGGEKHEGDQGFPPRIYMTKKGEKQASPPKGTIAAPGLATADIMPSDKWIIDQTIQTICHHDPDFIYVLLNNIDTAGHMYGAFTDLNTSNLGNIINPDAMKDQLYITDSQVKRFLEFLERRETLEESRIIITSDHGMSTMKESKRSPDVRKTLRDTAFILKQIQDGLLTDITIMVTMYGVVLKERKSISIAVRKMNRKSNMLLFIIYHITMKSLMKKHKERKKCGKEIIRMSFGPGSLYFLRKIMQISIMEMDMQQEEKY